LSAFAFLTLPVKKYIIRLTPDERTQLLQMVCSGRAAARAFLHAHILLKADDCPETPAWSDEAIRGTLEVHATTVARVRQRFVEEGLEAALRPKPTTRQYERKLDGTAEAHLIALAFGRCLEAKPNGRCACWPTNWSNCGMSLRSRTRRCAAH